MINTGTQENFEELTKEGVTLVDFWAPWCGPCKMIAPVLDELDKTMGEKVKIVKVNVDEQQEIARNHGIMSIPTLLLFKDGKIVDQRLGFQPLEILQDWVNLK